MFGYSKPLVAALNGHTIAAGCMLALSCDYRVMVYGKAKIALNEINIGATVLAGGTEMLRFLVGNKNATKILYSGAMFSADEAEALGLVDEVTSYDNLTRAAVGVAGNLGNQSNVAFKNIKSLLRNPVIGIMKQNEKKSIEQFVDIWYSEKTQEHLINL